MVAVAEATADPEEARTDRPAIARLILISGYKPRHPGWDAVVFYDNCQGILTVPESIQFSDVQLLIVRI